MEFCFKMLQKGNCKKPLESADTSYLHHSDCWVDLGRQRNVNLIFVSVNAERTNVI